MTKLNTLIAVAFVAAAGAAYADDVQYPAHEANVAVSVQLGGPVTYSGEQAAGDARAASVAKARLTQAQPFNAQMAAAELKKLYIN
jgi:hypothetical protein